MITSPHEIEQALGKLLASVNHENGNALEVAQVRRGFAETHRDHAVDNLTHGSPPHEPYWDLILDDAAYEHDAVWVVAVWRPETMTLYVGASPRDRIIGVCDQFALSEVESFEDEILQIDQVAARSVIVSRALAEYWLAE